MWQPTSRARRRFAVYPVRMHGAGWYADPGGKARVFRWWDGTGWTRWLSRDPSPPDPAPPAEPAVPGTADFPPPVGEPVEAPARPRMIAGGILAAVLLAVMAGGAVVSLTEDRMPTGPAVAPADAAPPPALIDYNPQTGRVSAEEMSYTVPGRPYRCDAAAAERQPTFRSVHSCFASRARELRPHRPRLGQHVELRRAEREPRHARRPRADRRRHLRVDSSAATTTSAPRSPSASGKSSRSTWAPRAVAG